MASRYLEPDYLLDRLNDGLSDDDHWEAFEALTVDFSPEEFEVATAHWGEVAVTARKIAEYGRPVGARRAFARKAARALGYALSYRDEWLKGRRVFVDEHGHRFESMDAESLARALSNKRMLVEFLAKGGNVQARLPSYAPNPYRPRDRRPIVRGQVDHVRGVVDGRVFVRVGEEGGWVAVEDGFYSVERL